jgi:thiol-disulfide isomerase/thioredoxin
METAPSFCLEKLGSDEKVCLEYFKGKPVLIQFWVSWCPDCMREVPLLEHFYRSISTDELIVLTINVTGREGTTDQRDEFVDSISMTAPVLIDEGTSVYDQFRCTSVPATVLFDSEHRITETFSDQDRFQDILAGVSRLLTR